MTRFMFQPGAPLGPQAFGRRGDIDGVPAASLRDILVESRTRIFLGIWLATNFVFGAFAQKLGLSDMPVAWVAHVGGFAAGLLLFGLFDPPPRLAGAPAISSSVPVETRAEGRLTAGPRRGRAAGMAAAGPALIS